MKKINYLLGLIVLSLLLGAYTCDTGDTYPAMDDRLFGYWVFVNHQEEVFSWRFTNDFKAVQTTPHNTVNWNWEAYDGPTGQADQIKLWTVSDNTWILTYKIEGDLLYFWVDELEEWSFPYTRISD